MVFMLLLQTAAIRTHEMRRQMSQVYNEMFACVETRALGLFGSPYRFAVTRVTEKCVMADTSEVRTKVMILQDFEVT